MSDPMALCVGDGLCQASVQAVGVIDNGPGAKPGFLTCTYKAPKGELFASILIGTVPKGKQFDMDKLALKAGWMNMDHIINAMRRCGYGAPESAKVAKALCDMADEPDEEAT